MEFADDVSSLASLIILSTWRGSLARGSGKLFLLRERGRDDMTAVVSSGVFRFECARGNSSRISCTDVTILAPALMR